MSNKITPQFIKYDPELVKVFTERKTIKKEMTVTWRWSKERKDFRNRRRNST